MITKLPGFYYTAYATAQFYNQPIVSQPDYRVLLDDFMADDPAKRVKFERMISSYNFTDDIPKLKVFIKLADDISDDRKDFIANGVRSFFRDDGTILLDVKQTLK